MTDIVEWLKGEAKECLPTNMFRVFAKPEDTRYWEAATEIERLRRQAMSKRTLYLHTIDNKPAAFEGTQICFLNFYGEAFALASSLKQIRKEQRATKKYRRQMGFAYDENRYGYFRVLALETGND